MGTTWGKVLFYYDSGDGQEIIWSESDSLFDFTRRDLWHLDGYDYAVDQVIPDNKNDILHIILKNKMAHSFDVSYGEFFQEVHTLTAGEIAATQFTATSIPLDDLAIVNATGGPMQLFTSDYTITTGVIGWAGLGMAASLATADKFQAVGAITAGFTGTVVQEQFTLDAGDITNKYITLSAAPLGDVVVGVEGRGIQFGDYATDEYDFEIISSKLSWDGKDLEGELAVSDVIQVYYVSVDGGRNIRMKYEMVTLGSVSSFTLSKLPIDNVCILAPYGGCMQMSSVDFTVSHRTITILSPLSAVLSVGDKVGVFYPYDVDF